MKFIIGRKIGMTRVFDDDGRSFAVSKVLALPSKISQIKNKEKDGYLSVQVSAFKLKNDKEKNIRTREFKEENIKKYKVGDEVKASQFKANEYVTVEGIGKGKGFAGTVKRHGFAMGPVTHGSKNIRKPGSIGGGYPERVVKGRKMAGRMGGKNVTVKNLRVVDVEDDIILIAGAIPGANNSIVKVFGKGEKAEEVVDFAAEEEKRAQEKMLEEQKAEKAEEKPAETDHVSHDSAQDRQNELLTEQGKEEKVD